jgi:hypothetical protein
MLNDWYALYIEVESHLDRRFKEAEACRQARSAASSDQHLLSRLRPRLGFLRIKETNVPQAANPRTRPV